VIRGVFHRARTVAPQHPLERPASDFACVVAWPPPHRRSTPFHPCRPFRAARSQAPVHAPRCQREARFSEPRRSLPTSATVNRRAGTPDERSILAREWGFRPATRRHQPMPVASVSRCVAAPETCEPRSVRDGSSHAAFHLRGRDRPWAEAPEQRRTRVLGRIRACPSRSASSTRVTGSTRREVWSPSQLVAPAEIPLGCRPAKGDTVEEIEVLFAALEPLRERRIAPPCAP